MAASSNDDAGRMHGRQAGRRAGNEGPTSFSEYRDRATMSSSFLVSAWNSWVSDTPGKKKERQKIRED